MTRYILGTVALDVFGLASRKRFRKKKTEKKKETPRFTSHPKHDIIHHLAPSWLAFPPA